MKKENYARKGFTLVELLIVIVVIGILSAMMMLSSTEAVSSAKASNIVSNLRNLKTATLAWYADHIDWVKPDGTVSKAEGVTSGGKNIKSALMNTASDTETDNKFVNIIKYFNSEGSIVFNSEFTSGGYTLTSVNDDGWYVGYKFVASETSIKEKIDGRAKSLGLKFGNDTAPVDNITYNNATTVWMKVLGISSHTTNPNG